MKKKLALILSLCFILLTLGACGTDPKDVDYNGVSYNQLQDYSANLITSLTGYSSSDLDSLLSDNSNLDEKTSNMVQKWKETVADIGDYQGTGEFSIDKSGNTLTTDQILHFEKRDVDFQVVINYTDMTVTGYSVEPVYSLGEKMEKAGMNTVISMCVVFAVLILISLIIYAFKIFPYLEKKKQEKSEPSVAKDPVVTQIEQKEEQQLADDNELVAVIAAAIAASTGTSTSDFVVRSINRR
ncbi:sodium pump decarboxylase [Roseburia sp. MUC/MUC-530-WT-4D]|uniref:Sodium pump decarboxylase n=1 Tax=Roseburia porci TaxID=2605790 RepID=A0A6L5YQC3_9FIRM|nr:OadG family protein [Roseburia porci]MST74056.1 sodium pump decarboxylase [Roseburia porci]